jgi:hemerythrin-like metal-binding protein
MTAGIEWKPYYSVSEPFLDDQHKEIIGLVNDLYVALERGNDGAVVKPLLDKFARYAKEHFDCEEQIMQEHGYPLLEEHKALHDQARNQIADMQSHADLITGRDLLNFFKTWWVEHIQGDDKKYAPYMKVPVES